MLEVNIEKLLRSMWGSAAYINLMQINEYCSENERELVYDKWVKINSSKDYGKCLQMKKGLVQKALTNTTSIILK